MRSVLAPLTCLLVVVAAPNARGQATIGEPLEQGDVARNQDDDEPADAGPSKASADAGTSARSAADDVVQGQAFGLIAPPPKVNESSIVKSWQQRVERQAAGDTKRVEAEEAHLRSIRDELGIENLLSPATAYVREADALIESGHGADAVTRCQEAIAVAPEFNLAHFCLARATLARSPLAVMDAISAFSKGYSATMDDVRARRNAITSVGLTSSAGVAIACALLVLLLLLRGGWQGLHDFHHLFPMGVPIWQTTLVAMVLLGLPYLVGTGLFGVVAVAAVALSFVLKRNEAIVMAVAVVLATGAQIGAGAAVRAGAFARVAQDVYLLERGDAPEAAAKRLSARSDQGLGNFATAFALGHYHKRFGHYAEALKAYDAARKLRNSADVLNNIANVQTLQGDTEEAKKTYLAAISANSRLAAPLWNIAKIYFKETKVEQGEQAFARARALDPANATRAAGQGTTQEDQHANQVLVDAVLPNEAIDTLANREAREVSTGDATWPLLTGHLSELGVVILGLLTVALIVGGQFAQRRLHPSGSCERCGRSVCTRCDPELAQGSAMCGQCISVFVRKTGVDPADRVRKEIEVNSHNRRRAILARVMAILVGGGGHVVTGHIIVGAIFVTFFSMLLSHVVFWHGVLQAPVPVSPAVSMLQIALLGVGFILVLGVSFWHLSRVEEGP